MEAVHVLMLEPSAADAEQATAQLQSEGPGFSVTGARTRSAFDAALPQRQWDLILCEYAFPGGSADEILDLVQRDQPDTPLIFVSGPAGDDHAVALLRHGAADYVSKQRMGRLAPAVQRALRETEARRTACRLEKALNVSESRYRRLVETIREYAIFTVDLNGDITSWNNGAEAIFGYPAAEVLGTPFARLFAEDSADQHAQREMDTAAANGQAVDDDWMARKDGRRLFASGVLNALRDETGKLLAYSKVLRDITERKHMEEALRTARDAAEGANRAKDHFLAVLSHELRTPLSPVLMTVQLLATETDLPQNVTDALKVIRRNVELEARLIDDLLDVTGIIRGKLQLHLAETNLHASIQNVLDICQSDVSGKRHDLHLHLNATNPAVLADSSRILQILWNLLKNAIKFTPPNGQITISTSNPDGQSVRVEVCDSGIGIEAAAVPRIFKAFEQEQRPPAQRFGGLGLGLAIANSLAEMHKGQLTVYSAGPNTGSCFALTLPVLLPGQQARRSSQAQQCPPRLLHVLFVEDHPDTARVMGRVLKRLGYDVTTAGTVKEALGFVADRRFDLLVSDIGLPDGTGLEIVEQMEPKIPAVALTGFGMEADVARSRKAGFSEHLTKPVDIDKLAAVLRSMAEKMAESA